MSEFSKGKWRNEGNWIVADNIPIAEVCTEYDEGMTYSEQSERLRNANARLIAAAPEMYQLICDFLKVDKQKACAATAKNDPAYMMALIAQNGVVNMAKALVARIDGEEDNHE
ncbi:MAG: hypothetical protein IJ587_04885 [Synergistaceae bacterium]|nr:hypothetical protein [Synergistaceae bacterium]